MEGASVEAAPSAGANFGDLPATGSPTGANDGLSSSKEAMAANYTANASSRLEAGLRAALLGKATPTQTIPETTTVAPEEPLIPVTEEATQPAVEAVTEPVAKSEVTAEPALGDADETPEDYGPEDVKAALKRIHPDARKTLHDAFYRSEEIKKLDFKIEDLRLMKNAGFTPERMLTTLQRFPVPEAEVDALRDASSFQQLFDDMSSAQPQAVMGLAQTLPPESFKRLAAEFARANEVIDPQSVTLKEKAIAKRLVNTFRERGKTRGGEDGEQMTIAADMFAADMGLGAQAKEPEIPDELRRRMSDQEKQIQEYQQRQQQEQQRYRSGFEESVYGSVRSNLETEATKMLGDNLSQEQKSFVLGNTLRGVEQAIVGNQVLMRNIRRMIENGPLDQAHHTAVVTQVSEIARRLVVANLSTQLKELKKLSGQASLPARVAPAQATVTPRTAPPAQPRREPVAQGATPPPQPGGKIEISKGGGADAASRFLLQGLRNAGLG